MKSQDAKSGEYSEDIVTQVLFRVQSQWKMSDWLNIVPQGTRNIFILIIRTNVRTFGNHKRFKTFKILLAIFFFLPVTNSF